MTSVRAKYPLLMDAYLTNKIHGLESEEQKDSQECHCHVDWMRLVRCAIIALLNTYRAIFEKLCLSRPKELLKSDPQSSCNLTSKTTLSAASTRPGVEQEILEKWRTPPLA